jgi:hypothetical protein
MDCTEPLSRIEKALLAATETLKAFTPGKIESTLKDGGDPVTEADVLLDNVLRAFPNGVFQSPISSMAAPKRRAFAAPPPNKPSSAPEAPVSP